MIYEKRYKRKSNIKCNTFTSEMRQSFSVIHWWTRFLFYFFFRRSLLNLRITPNPNLMLFLPNTSRFWDIKKRTQKIDVFCRKLKIYTFMWNNVSNREQLLLQQSFLKPTFIVAPLESVTDYRIQKPSKWNKYKNTIWSILSITDKAPLKS